MNRRRFLTAMTLSAVALKTGGAFSVPLPASRPRIPLWDGLPRAAADRPARSG